MSLVGGDGIKCHQRAIKRSRCESVEECGCWKGIEKV